MLFMESIAIDRSIVISYAFFYILYYY